MQPLHKYTIISFKCSICGTKREVLKKKSKQFKGGHIKDMFCITCQKETQYIQEK